MSATTAGAVELLERARREFADRNPESGRLHAEASKVLPGGHTRTVLAHEPFALTFVRGEGAVLTDADGHEYVDLLGDYTAGLLGHSDRRVLDAAHLAMAELASVGGLHAHEAELARLMCERFGLDRVRFTNSGTEANLMAITTATQATGRSKLLVFEGGYHGGVLAFGGGAAASNAPYDFVVAPYNDLAGATALIDDGLAAVLVEPMLGAGGCVVADPDFLVGVFDAARSVGAVCIADEVMTSRHGRSGLASLLGATADLTTYGKYIGGGFSFGAFGGKAELLDRFDTRRPDYIAHAGTFNNNRATMAAGCVVLGDVFTADVAEAHTARGEAFRGELAAVLGRSPLPVSVSGYGSSMTIHALAVPPTDGAEAARRDAVLQELIFLGLYERGVYAAPRGMINLSLPLTDDQLGRGSRCARRRARRAGGHARALGELGRQAPVRRGVRASAGRLQPAEARRLIARLGQGGRRSASRRNEGPAGAGPSRLLVLALAGRGAALSWRRAVARWAAALPRRSAAVAGRGAAVRRARLMARCTAAGAGRAGNLGGSAAALPGRRGHAGGRCAAVARRGACASGRRTAAAR